MFLFYYKKAFKTTNYCKSNGKPKLQMRLSWNYDFVFTNLLKNEEQRLTKKESSEMIRRMSLLRISNVTFSLKQNGSDKTRIFTRFDVFLRHMFPVLITLKQRFPTGVRVRETSQRVRINIIILRITNNTNFIETTQ